MKMQQVREMARRYKINTFGMTKADLIREIQRKEGNFSCFGTAEDFCDRSDCCFRSLCLGEDGKKKP